MSKGEADVVLLALCQAGVYRALQDVDGRGAGAIWTEGEDRKRDDALWGQAKATVVFELHFRDAVTGAQHPALRDGQVGEGGFKTAAGLPVQLHSLADYLAEAHDADSGRGRGSLRVRGGSGILWSGRSGGRGLRGRGGRSGSGVWGRG
jgi:hypothetical protein